MRRKGKGIKRERVESIEDETDDFFCLLFVFHSFRVEKVKEMFHHFDHFETRT